MSFQGLLGAIKTVRIVEELVEIWLNEVCDSHSRFWGGSSIEYHPCQPLLLPSLVAQKVKLPKCNQHLAFISLIAITNVGVATGLRVYSPVHEW